MENKFFFIFQHGNQLKKYLTPLIFSNFLRNPPECLIRNKEFLKGSIWDVLMVESLLGVGRPYPKLWGKYQKPYIQDFIDFVMKTH